MKSRKRQPKIAVQAESGPAGPVPGAAPVPVAIPAPSGEPLVSLRSRLLLVWLCVTAGCAFLQPGLLGFYVDDWPVVVEPAGIGKAFSAVRWQHCYGIDNSRPMAAVLRFLLSSLLGREPLVWQAALLGTGILIAWLTFRLMVAMDREINRETALAVSACWLAMPWLAGFVFWPTLLPVHLVFAGAIGLASWLLGQWRKGRAPFWAPATAYAAFCLSYEVFFFQFIAFAALGASLAARSQARARNIIVSNSGMLAGLAAAIWWYRRATDARPISGRWAEDLQSSIWNLPGQGLAAASEVRWPLCAACAALLALCAVSWLRRRGEWRSPDTYGLYLNLVACLAGAALSIFAFSLGGRAPLGLGVESRSMFLLSFWLLPMAALLGSAALSTAGPRLRRALAFSALAVGLLLTAARLQRMYDWAQAWDLAKTTLAEVPYRELAKAEANSLVLMVGNYGVNGAPVFTASWDLSVAMRVTFPNLQKLRFLPYNPHEGIVKWDGRNLSYRAIARNEPIPGFYIWRPTHHEFYKPDSPIQINPDFTVTKPPAP